MSKRDSIDKAKALLKEKSVKEASILFNEVLETYPDDINGWDTFFIIQCQRAGGNIKNLDEWVEKQKDFDKVQNIYSWLLYDIHIKNFQSSNITQHEKGIKKLLEYSNQKDFSVEGVDDIPCPYTLGVFKLIKNYRKPNLNITKVAEWIEELEPAKLSRKENVFTDQTGKERRLASPYEDYYAILSSLRIKEERFNECIELCDYALENIKRFHYDNDIWFKRRKALSLIKIDREEEGFELLISLSKDRKGDKWFLYHEIAEVYFENEDYSHALEYCKKGIKAFGDEAFKINLLILTARTLFKLERLDDAAILANYMVGISVVYDLKEKADLSRITSYFKIDKSTIEIPKKYLANYRRKVDEIFKIDRNIINKKKKFTPRKSIKIKDGDEVKGWISAVHGNGKSGHVKVGNDAYFFSMKEVKADKQKLDRGINVMLGFKDAMDRDGNPDKHAVILNVIE
jgi:tetratricopeptide (TPR) repeat protein